VCKLKVHFKKKLLCNSKEKEVILIGRVVDFFGDKQMRESVTTRLRLIKWHQMKQIKLRLRDNLRLGENNSNIFIYS